MNDQTEIINLGYVIKNDTNGHLLIDHAKHSKHSIHSDCQSNILRKSVLGVIFIVFIIPLSKAHPKTTHTIPWTANWIWQDEDGPENTWMCFRKTFHLTQIPSTVVAYIAADSKYWMYINGAPVVFEGCLNRGPTRTDGYFDEVDIQPYLTESKNTIAVLVWYWGNEGRNNVDSGKGGLLFQTDMGDFIINSDSSWKMKIHPAYGNVPFIPNAEEELYLYGGWNIGFDARYDITGWYLNDYDDSSWFVPVEKGSPPVAPWNELWKRPIPQWKNYGLRNYGNSADFPAISDGERITAELPYNAQITPYLKIDASAGLMVKIETDHHEVNGYYGQRTEYITKDGIQEFESLAWQNGERVFYDIPAGVNILALKYRETGYASEFTGSFSCSDVFYNQLYQKAARTLYVCMRDNYMDCPDRERGQWIGDVAAMVPQTFYIMDRNADFLTLKCIREFINWQENNILKGLVPGVHDSELAAQSLCAISPVGIIWTYTMHTGDLTAVTESYPAVKNYLDVWSPKEKGRLNLRSWWNGQGIYIDDELIETIWYYMALNAAVTMAEITGNYGDIEAFQAKMDTIAIHFDRNFWNQNGYRSTYFYDDRANGLVLLSGLAGEDKWDTMVSLLMNKKNAMPFMEQYILEGLFKTGHTDCALDRIKDRYTRMLSDSNCTTLWETFEPLGTTNHGWTGAAAALLVRYVAGVNPVTPGYSTYSVLPQLGPLTYVNVVVPSKKGDIALKVDGGNLQYTINLESPDGTTAIVGIPKNAFTNEEVGAINVNNTIVWKTGSYSGGAAGISWNGEDDLYYKLNVSPGTYTITGLAVSVSVNDKVKPHLYLTAENFPNPFNAGTRIRIQIPVKGRTTVKVYNLRGEEMCTLLDQDEPEAEKDVFWDGMDNRGMAAASGVYVYQVISGNKEISKKMLLMK